MSDNLTTVVCVVTFLVLTATVIFGIAWQEHSELMKFGRLEDKRCPRCGREWESK